MRGFTFRRKANDPRSGGFTLVELVVVMGIMAVLAAMMIPQMNQFNKDQSLPQAADAFQEAFRVAQANATSGTQCPGDTSTAWYAELKGPNSYGIGSVCTATTPAPVISPTLSSINVVDVGMSGTAGEICDQTSDFTGMGVSFQNITGAVNFLPGLTQTASTCNATQMASATKMTITLQQGTDTTKQAKVAIEKGGSIYVVSQ